MSFVLRVFLAVLVVLPPGTFRKLDELTRKKAVDVSMAVQSGELRVTNCSHPAEKPVKSPDGGLPGRARKWSDTTFLSSSEIVRLIDGFAAAPPGEQFSLELIDCRQQEMLFREPAPALNAHRGARGLLLAMGELLV